MRTIRNVGLVIGLPLLCLAPGARAQELVTTFGGQLQSDLRFRMNQKEVGEFYHLLKLPDGVSRNENILKLKLEAAYGDNVSGTADVDFVWRGYPEAIEQVGDLAYREKLDPYYLKVHALYLEATDWLVDGLDLRVGQQLVLWGKADQFNPTNTLNASDLEDILLFGQRMANFMVKADYSFLDQWTLSGVLVPVFKPAQLPFTAPLALAAVDRLPFAESQLRYRVNFEKALGASANYPTIADRVAPELPVSSFANMQFGFQLAGNLFEQDLAVSFTHGRSDIPQPIRNTTVQDVFADPLCDPADGTRCVDGLLRTDAFLGYPKVDVIGFNLAGELPISWLSDSLQGIGYRIELGVYLPESTHMRIYQGDIVLMGQTQPAGEYGYNLGTRPGCTASATDDCQIQPTVVSDQAFAKWTIGLDYSFGTLLYVNAMWVHGFPDEFGAGDFLYPKSMIGAHRGMVVRQSWTESENPMGCLLGELFIDGNRARALETCGKKGAVEILRPRIGDYAVLGLDFKFSDDKGLFRILGIWDVSGYYEDRWDEAAGRRVLKYLSLFDKGFSAILYPEFRYNFGSGLELGFGALLQLGEAYSKFGDPASGGNLVWTRARFSW